LFFVDPDAVSAAVVVALVCAWVCAGFVRGSFVLACHESCERVCEGGVVVEVFGVVLVEACADHDGFGSVELFVAFAHEPGSGLVDEAAADEVLDVRIKGGAGACGVLRDVRGGAFTERAHGVEDFPSDGIGERFHRLGVFDDEERDRFGRGLVGHGVGWVLRSGLIGMGIWIMY